MPAVFVKEPSKRKFKIGDIAGDPWRTALRGKSRINRLFSADPFTATFISLGGPVGPWTLQMTGGKVTVLSASAVAALCTQLLSCY